jgi:hypothetical protein
LVQGLSSHLHAKWATQNESQFVTVKLGALFGPDAWTGLVSSLVLLYPGGVQCCAKKMVCMHAAISAPPAWYANCSIIFQLRDTKIMM